MYVNFICPLVGQERVTNPYKRLRGRLGGIGHIIENFAVNDRRIQLLQLFNTLKPRANGRNIVGQQLPNIVLNVASVCTPCCMLFMLLPLVGSCCAKFVTGQTFSYMQTDATTSNIVRPAMLGVNGTVFTNRDVGSCCSVCTYYKSSVKPPPPPPPPPPTPIGAGGGLL